MPSEQEFAIEQDGFEQHRRLVLRGRLDGAASPALQGAIVRLCDGRCATIVLDLRELGSIDSAGMHTLIAGCEGAIHQGHELRVLPGARIEDVRELTEVLAGLPLLAATDGGARPTRR